MPVPPEPDSPGSGGYQSEPPDDEAFVRKWFKRISAAAKQKKKWEDLYEVSRSRDYVLGHQRDEDDEYDAQGDRRYQLNRMGAAMKAKLPSIWYYLPYYRVVAAAAREDTPAQTVDSRARLLQDTLNAIVRQPQTRLQFEGFQALKEAFWAFGIVEWGLEQDWSENPLGERPAPLIEDEKEKEEATQTVEELAESALTAAGAVAVGAATAGAIPPPGMPGDPLSAMVQEMAGEYPKSETFYVRYIPARQFFVASNDRADMMAQDWFGYWEWMYVEDVKRTPSFQNTEELKATGVTEGGSSEVAETDRHHGDLYPLSRGDEKTPPSMVPIWKIWDLRTKKRYVLAEGHPHVLKNTSFRYPCIGDLRLDVIPGEWYPLPPLYSQLMEQDEYNDSREYLRVTRKSTIPRYTYDKNAFAPAELQKLENDDIGTFVAVENANSNPIMPIPQPSLAGDAIRTIALSSEGFTEVSAVSPQARQMAAASSATEANILEQKGDVRDSYEQRQVGEWLAVIGRGLLRTAIEKMLLPQWVRINADPYSPSFPEDAMAIAEDWKRITQEELQNADDLLTWDVVVQVENLSPLSEQQEAARWLQVLNLISTSPVGKLLALSPELLKRTLDLGKIRNAQDQASIGAALAAATVPPPAPPGGGSPPKAPGVSPMPGEPSPNPPAGPMPPAPPGPPS
jgi:hypothetical protein